MKNGQPNFINVPIISKEEFRKRLLSQLVDDKKGYTAENIFDILLDDGFPKLDFDDLNKCLSSMFVCFDTVAVDFGDREYVWLVSVNKAILVRKPELEIDN